MAIVPRVIGISPGDHGCGRTLTWLVQGAVDGGIDSLILREPHLSRPAYVELARRLSPLLNGGPILHASHPDAIAIAHRSGWGLHLPGSVEWSGVRSHVTGLLGMSCHTLDDLAKAAACGADYATLSPVFSPISKPADTRPTLGLSGLSAAVEGGHLPIVGIGGITADNAQQVAETGCHGIGVIGHLFPSDVDSDAVAATANRLVNAFQRGL
mgnify:CR=1 FL=1